MVRAFLEAGATVIAPARSPASQARLQSELAALPGAAEGRLHVPLADHGTLEGAQALASFVRQLCSGGVDHVISIAGGMPPPGTLTEAMPEGLAAAVDSRVAPHLWLARALVPLLTDRPSSSYTIVTGALGEVCPWKEAALTAVTNGALYAAAVALQAELRGRPPRCNELRICTVVCRDGETENLLLPGVPAIPSSRVAAAAVGVAAGQQRDAVVRVGGEGQQG